MALTIPHPGWRITLTPDPIPDAFDRLAGEDPLRGARRWVFFDEEPPFLIVEERFDAPSLRSDPRVVAVDPVWYIIAEDVAAWVAYTGRPDVPEHHPGCIWWADRDGAVADLARTYPPLATLCSLAQAGMEPLAGLAREALRFDAQALTALLAALDAAGDPRAAVIRAG
jgi:hypothetical protein